MVADRYKDEASRQTEGERESDRERERELEGENEREGLKVWSHTEINLNSILMQRHRLTEMNGFLHFWPFALNQHF